MKKVTVYFKTGEVLELQYGYKNNRKLYRMISKHCKMSDRMFYWFINEPCRVWRIFIDDELVRR